MQALLKVGSAFCLSSELSDLSETDVLIPKSRVSYRTIKWESSDTTGSSGDCSLTGAIRAISYCTTTVDNPITGEKQRVQLSPQQEVVGTTGAIRNGGSVWRSLQTIYSSGDQVGTGCAEVGGEERYLFEFHLLRDPQTVNARREDRFSSLLVC